MDDPTSENHMELLQEIKDRMRVDKIFNTAFPHQMEAIKNGNIQSPTNFECYRDYITFYQDKCGEISEYALKHLKVIVGECENLGAYPEFLQKSKDSLEKACKENTQ